jgi:hypothetical protein
MARRCYQISETSVCPSHKLRPYMDEPDSKASSTKLSDELESMRRAELATALRYDLTSYSGSSISFGIMLAGAAYPIIIAAVIVAMIIVQIITRIHQFSPPRNLMELAIIPFFVVGTAAVGSLLAIVWTGILSTMTLPVVLLFVQSLKLRGSLVWLGAASGGLVGFIAALPMTLTLPRTLGRGDFGELFVALALGPGFATLLGQIGGAWGGWRAWRSSEHFYGLTIARAQSSTAPADGEPQLAEAGEVETGPGDHRIQFGLRHMMWLTVWISVLLCVIRLSGIPFEYVLPLIAGWIVYQWITLRVGERLIRYLGPKWVAWRSLRST